MMMKSLFVLTWIITRMNHYINVTAPGPAQNSRQDDDEENYEEEDEEGGKAFNQPKPAVQIFKEATDSLEEVQQFPERKDHLVAPLGSIFDSVVPMKNKPLTQRSLFDYFSPQ